MDTVDEIRKRNLLVLKLLRSGYRAKDLDTGKIVSVKTRVRLDVVELDTMVFAVTKEWIFKDVTYLSGDILDFHFDLDSIDVPGHRYIEIQAHGITDWYQPYELRGSIGECLRGGKRMSYEFEDYTGYGFYGPDTDPVYESSECNTFDEKYDMLAKLWEEYPECIDAIVHIGYIYLRDGYSLRNAANCFHAAIHIAEKELPDSFDGMFLWGNIYNRPYLRALHGLVLLQWRKNEFEKAAATACKMLRLNPSDNHGIRFIIDEIKNHSPWTEDM